MRRLITLFLTPFLAMLPSLLVLGSARGEQVATAPPVGVPVAYELPTDGPLPRTYRVTLAIVDARDPRWIISQFAAGVARTVTAENHGRFEEVWDGLDDNFMPVPPGTYGVKGIYAPAKRWAIDGQAHAIVPSFAGGPSAWLPTGDAAAAGRAPPVGGDPTSAPLRDVDATADGIAVFYYQYLENGLNNPLVDLKRPLGPEQVLRGFFSGGAAGGSATCTDGENVWSFSEDGGAKFVYRADAKSFGSGSGTYRSHVYRPAGWVKALACHRDAASGRTRVFVAEAGRIVQDGTWFGESDRDFVDRVSVLDGGDGATVATLAARRPRGLVARGDRLYVLEEGARPGTWVVAAAALDKGLPTGPLVPLFALPKTITPADLEVDSRGRFYVSDTAANKVYELDRHGAVVVTFGRAARQRPGAYDPLTLMAPAKLATWRAPDGEDRVLIVENDGPNRVSEWSAAGKLVREIASLQTKANSGYAPDPAHPSLIYMAGHGGWLTRFKVDYERHAWTVDAVWPLPDDPRAPGFDHPKAIRVGGRLYLVCARSRNIYRLDGARWVLSSAILTVKTGAYALTRFLWHDANGDGRVEDDEFRSTPLAPPGALLKYHGEQWLDDLSVVATNLNGADVWRLAPKGFDAHGNPVFGAWERLLVDPVLAARARGAADAVHGGNEMSNSFDSDWSEVDGAPGGDLYVIARGGPSFNADDGGQYRLSRYAPQAAGGYAQQWRVGRTAFQGVAREGELYGAIHVVGPINGLVSVIDPMRAGVLLFTTDGLYVESVFPDMRRFPRTELGLYGLPGEFFAGTVFANRDNGKIYFGMGKETPLLFEAVGWSLTDNPVRPLEKVAPRVSLTASRIAPPPEAALKMRGGAGTARVAEIAPATGGATLDGSMVGWESARPVVVSSEADRKIEVRCLYDPEHLYLRWHVRLPWKLDPKPLAPVDRIFTHDRGADTVSLYLQGDPDAAPAGKTARRGDVRVVFGIFRDGAETRPVALGLYPAWSGPDANPVTYRTPGGQIAFAHVGELAGAKLAHVVDADGKGFVLVASLPRAAFPGLPPLGAGVRTTANFEATLGGHAKTWWANTDGSASRVTYDEPSEAGLYPGSWAPVTFRDLGAGLALRQWNVVGPFGFEELPNLEYLAQRARICATLRGQRYPPEGALALTATYSGAMTQTRARRRKLVWSLAKTPEDALVLSELPALSWSGQEGEGVFYLATWIYAPADADVRLTPLDGHGEHSIAAWLNGHALPQGAGPYANDLSLDAAKAAHLQRGWNQLLVRFDYIWGNTRIGIALDARPDVLWGLRVSPSPPRAAH